MVTPFEVRSERRSRKRPRLLLALAVNVPALIRGYRPLPFGIIPLVMARRQLTLPNTGP